MNVWLTDRDRDRARALVAGALPSTCTILRPADTRDEYGGQSREWVESDPVPCRVGPMNNQSTNLERDQSGAVTVVTRWQVTLPAGTEVTQRDRIRVGGRLLEVINTKAPRDWEISTVVDCVEVD